jgi:hypothetical protein
MMARTPPRWCERCFHPIDPSEAVFVEAYRLVGDFERKVYFHDRCFDPANPAYLDALMRYSDGRVTTPIKAPSKPAKPAERRAREGAEPVDSEARLIGLDGSADDARDRAERALC